MPSTNRTDKLFFGDKCEVDVSDVAIASAPTLRQVERDRVLIVEDDEDAALLERRTLEQHGYVVEWVGTIADALRALESRPFDIVVADYCLQSATGLDLHEQIQEHGFNVPLIMVTGYTSENTAIQALRRGVRDFVPKSDEYLRYLADAVERVLLGRRAERGLAESEARFYSFVEDGPAVAFLVDEVGRIVYANHRYETECGQSSILGKSYADLWQPATCEQLRANDRQARLAGTAIQFDEVLTRNDGTQRHWLTYRFPLNEPGACLLGGMAVDVTEQRLAEEALRKSDELLRQSQKLEALGRLAGGVAHDFNNILTIILGCTELLHETPAISGEARELIEQIHKAGIQASGLTRQLLAFSRKQVLCPVRLDINTHLTEMQRILGRLVGEDIQWIFRFADNLWPVRVDVGQLEQVIINLVVNARDAMPQGGELTIETANVVVSRPSAAGQGSAPAEYVLLKVSDTGCGMDEATKAQIFEPFFSTKGQQGTGLGLATVYGIVEQSGGYVEVDSQPGRGAAFRVYLPRDRETAPNVVSRPDGDGHARGSETILLVEDDDGVRTLAHEALLRSGYHVVEAGSGASALAVAAQYRGTIHLLATDVVMPTMSGRELAQRIQKVRPEIRVLYMTGYMDDAIVRHGLHPETVPILQKPFTPKALAAKVRNVLDRTNMAEQ